MIAFVRRAMVALLLGAGLAVVPVAAAHADEPPVWSSWDVAHSGQCMDVPNWGTSNKLQLQQSPCNGSTAQLFDLEPVGDEGFYLIRNYNSGKCLDVRDRSKSNNAAVQQYTCHGDTNQWWFKAEILSVPGYYHFVNRNSWKCLTVRDGSILALAKLVQYDCNPGGVTTHQAWR
ncbi:RICIN domain-containing protein [Dactylosporangium aurantiacum]|uniref:RICIN domain-containing protein n=1 Tax=Dactylosporangium aurantiacum TaxID=35754 RepID=A0A9Q9MDA0_9ACTN|nr:RICIN domain-containing protein [Dactylosporangium aurantiacum]MDG6103666.1 RICIN domain-containing protein [Dactylosporangium aurantiacum]UWZ51849.1 RICIN domain-containing protein [Dactylosporangium aurantiacum]